MTSRQASGRRGRQPAGADSVKPAPEAVEPASLADALYYVAAIVESSDDAIIGKTHRTA